MPETLRDGPLPGRRDLSKRLAIRAGFAVGVALPLSGGMWLLSGAVSSAWSLVALGALILVLVAALAPYWRAWADLPWHLALRGEDPTPPTIKPRETARLWSDLAAAHRESTGLVQGLQGFVPWPLSLSPRTSRWWLAHLSRWLVGDALACAWATAGRPQALGAAAADEVARTAAASRETMAALGRPALVALAVQGAMLAAIWLGLRLLAPTVPWPEAAALTLIWGATLWFGLGVPLVAGWVTRIRIRALDGVEASQDWKARLQTSSPAFRRVLAWPGRDTGS